MSSGLTGLIPAAGWGVRAYPYTRAVPKGMLEVDGMPLIERNVRLLRDQLDIRDIVIVVGYLGDVIREHLGDGSRLGVRITYAVNDRIDLNLPYSIFVGSRLVSGRCCVVLADEYYVGSNHRGLLDPAWNDVAVACGVIDSQSTKQIRKNYLVDIRDGDIVALQEKPRVVTGTRMGTGTYLLAPEILARLRQAFEPDIERGPRDWTTWLGSLCGTGIAMRPFALTGRYVNVNSRDDLNLANAMTRDATFGERTATLVYLVADPTTVAPAPILEFASHESIHEILVLAPRAPTSLGAAGSHPKVRVVTASRPGAPEGALVLEALDHARGDILILCYSDGTFSPGDVDKFLVYLRDADLVVGSRTTRQMIEQGANMRGLVRFAHILLAKLLEVVWWRFDCRFTDLCCVYRALWRSTYRTIRPQLTSTGLEVLPEMVIEILRARRRIIEIPVNYRNPDVEHAGVHSRYQTPAVFWHVVRLIIRNRIVDAAHLWRTRRQAAPAAPSPVRVDRPPRVP